VSAVDYKAKWTEYEDKIIREVYPDRGIEAVHKLIPHRSLESIKKRATRTGLKRNHRWRGGYSKWSEERLKKLKDVLDAKGMSGAVKEFGITSKQIRRVLSQYGVPWSTGQREEDEIKDSIRQKGITDPNDVSKVYGCIRLVEVNAGKNWKEGHAKTVDEKIRIAKHVARLHKAPVISQEEQEEAIRNFINSKGVTVCPTRYAAPVEQSATYSKRSGKISL
jgi:hypothetical protein